MNLYVHHRVDIVLLSGDISDLPVELYYTATQEENDQYHKLLDKIVEEFVPLDKNIYYIPGNVSVYNLTVKINKYYGPCHN